MILSEEIISRDLTYSNILSYVVTRYCFMNLLEGNNGTEKEWPYTFFFSLVSQESICGTG